VHVRVLGAEDLERALPMTEAIAVSREAFRALTDGTVIAPPRARIEEPDRTTLLMGAGAVGLGRIAKVVNVFPCNAERSLPTIHGLVMVFDGESGRVRGLLDGATLTALRTGAATGLATDLLARPDAEVAAVLGAGAQARTQILALAAVRPVREIRVFARRPEQLAAFIERLAPRVTAQLVAAESSDAAVAGADIVCAATSSSEPVLDGERLRAGAHINGVGSFRRDMRELDARTIARAARIVVDSRDSALDEAGELIAASDAGITDPVDWVELGELIADPSRGRGSADEITVFKSVGHAVQDLFAAHRALDNAERLGLGQQIEL